MVILKVDVSAARQYLADNCYCWTPWQRQLSIEIGMDQTPSMCIPIIHPHGEGPTEREGEEWYLPQSNASAPFCWRALILLTQILDLMIEDRLHLAAWNTRISEREFSEAALELITASWSLGTEQSYSSAGKYGSYNSAGKLWRGWCKKREISPSYLTLCNASVVCDSIYKVHLKVGAKNYCWKSCLVSLRES